MPRSAQIYDVVIPPNQSRELQVEGGMWKIMSSTNRIDVRRDGGTVLKNLQNGQGERVDFRRLTFDNKTGSTNTISVLVADNAFIDDQVVLTADNLNFLTAPPLSSQGWCWSNDQAMVSLVPDQVLTPGLNVNGAIITSASMSAKQLSTNTHFALIIADVAPTTMTKGASQASVLAMAGDATSTLSCHANLGCPVNVPAGMGVWFMVDTTMVVNRFIRSASLRLL